MAMRRPAHGHRGDGVLEDQLLLVVGLEHDRIFVERANTARQLHAAEQINGDARPLLASRIEEGILNILRRLIFQSRSPLLSCAICSLGGLQTAWSSTSLALRERPLDSSSQRSAVATFVQYGLSAQFFKADLNFFG